MGLKNIIKTRNKELFVKMTALHFTDEVIINNNTKNNYNNNGIDRILKSINRKDKIIEKKEFGDKILLKRLKPFNVNIRMKK